MVDKGGKQEAAASVLKEPHNGASWYAMHHEQAREHAWKVVLRPATEASTASSVYSEYQVPGGRYALTLVAPSLTCWYHTWLSCGHGVPVAQPAQAQRCLRCCQGLQRVRRPSPQDRQTAPNQPLQARAPCVVNP